MVDNIAVTAGSGTTVATDDVGGVQYQRVKVAHGADGSATDSSAAAPFPVQDTPATTGGLSPFRSIDLDESEEEVKATAGQVYFLHLQNLHASSARFVKFYNATAASVTVGTSTPLYTFRLAAGETITESIPQGLAFSTAITVAATTGIADADTGAPGANEVVVNLGYK